MTTDGGLVLRPPILPMRVTSVGALPEPRTCRGGCRYEPKFDGWRCLAFVGRGEVHLQSRSGRPLHAYFPEVCRTLTAYAPPGTVLDGELIVWEEAAGRTSFSALQARVAAGRRLPAEAAARPAHLLCFDLLEDAGTELLDATLAHRRARLDALLAGGPAQLPLCPQTADVDEARRWLADWARTGVEGLVVKGPTTRYRPGGAGWAKFKPRETTEAVVGGVTGTLDEPASLLLGRYDAEGQLRYVGRTGPLDAEQRREVADLRPAGSEHPWPQPMPPGWVGHLGAREPLAYVPVRPLLVVEVSVDAAYDGGRWRHAARFVRGRPDLEPSQVPPWRPDGP